MTTKNILGELKALNRYIDLTFLFKFIGLFLLFYYGNLFFVDLSIPGGKRYSESFATNYNYISWITASLTYMSNFIGHVLGMDSYVRGSADILSTTSGHSVYIKWQCIGLGLYSFWFAFILSHQMNIPKKILFGLGGVLLIWLINCIRIALLLLALENNMRGWKKSLRLIGDVNHHDLYNYVCYAVIIGMIYIYYRKTSRKTAAIKITTDNKSNS